MKPTAHKNDKRDSDLAQGPIDREVNGMNRFGLRLDGDAWICEIHVPIHDGITRVYELRIGIEEARRFGYAFNKVFAGISKESPRQWHKISEKTPDSSTSPSKKSVTSVRSRSEGHSPTPKAKQKTSDSPERGSNRSRKR